MAINLGTAILELGANVTRLQGDLGKAANTVEKFSRDTRNAFSALKNVAITIVGLEVFRAQFAKYKEALDLGDTINKLSQKTGIATEDLSALDYAAKLSAVSTEELGSSLKKLAVNVTAAASGNEDAVRLFDAIGVSVKDLSGNVRPTLQILEELGDKFSGFEADAAKANLAVKLFGKSGDAFIPMLNSMREMTAEGRKFGAVYSKEAAEAAEKFNDNMDRLAAVSARAKVELLEGFLPKLIELQERLLSLSRDLGSVWKAIGAFLTFSGNESANPVQALDEIDAKLRTLKKTRDDLEQTGKSGVVADIKRMFNSDDIVIVTTQMTALEAKAKALRSIANFELSQIPFLDAGFNPADAPIKPKARAPVIPDKSAGDEARRDALAALKARAELSDKLIAESKREADSRKDFLDRFHSQGIISETSYYDAISSIQAQAFEESKRAIDAEIEIRKKVVSVAKPGSERTGAEKELFEAVRKRGDLERQFAIDSQKNYLDSKKAADDYANTVKALDARILDLRGNAQAAIAIRFEIDNEKSINLGSIDPEVQRRVDEIRRLTVRDAANEYLSTLQNIDAEILTITGDLRAAAAIRFDVGNRKLLERASEDPELDRRLKSLRALTLQEASLSAERERASISEQNLATAELRIQNSLRVGQVSEVEAMLQTSAARQKAIDQLEMIYEAQRKIVDSNPGNARAIADLEAFRAKLDELRSTADVLGDKFKTIGESAIGSFFEEFSKTGNALSAFKKFLSSIESELQKFAARELASGIWKTIFGAADGVTGASRSVTQSADGGRESQLGSYVGLALRLWSGFAGGGTSPASVGAGASTVDEAGFAGIDWEKYASQAGSARAMGGQVIANKPYLVGERRAEVFVPATSGRIAANDRQFSGDAMPAVNVTIMANDLQSFNRSEAQVSSGIARAVARARRNT